MHYYLYKIHNCFLENETNFLLTELKNAFIDTIEMHKKIIDYNYDLATRYLDQISGGGNIWIGTGLYKRIFVNFRSSFIEYITLANSDNIYSNLENNYLKIKNEIFKFAKDKLLSIINTILKKIFTKMIFILLIKLIWNYHQFLKK